VLLYLESLGNPRKFSRVSRRLAGRKPVVALKSGRTTQGVPVGQMVRRSQLPPASIESMFRQSGLIRVDTTANCSTSPNCSRTSHCRRDAGSRSSATPTP
jgi:acyl-CoA synthetase (NDP forming)